MLYLNKIKLVSALLFLTFASCTSNEFAESPPIDPLFNDFSSTFDQVAEARKVDLLIVVDNSRSMLPDQEKLSREFSNFVSQIADADYRIGVTTTDTNSPGKEDAPGFYGNLDINPFTGARYISKGDEDPVSAFKALIKRAETLGCPNNPPPDTFCPSFEERPLFAIAEAIRKRTSVNSGFFRDDADLAVLIITDEDEIDFDDGTYFSAQDLLDYFEEEFEGEKRMVSFSIAIPEGDQDCYDVQKEETNSKVAQYGVRVGALSDLTGGFKVSICNESFGEDLSAISSYVQKNLLPFKIEVPSTILAKSIVLSVVGPDGEDFPVDYAIGNGVLRVSPTPPEGSKINLSYKYD